MEQETLEVPVVELDNEELFVIETLQYGAYLGAVAPAPGSSNCNCNSNSNGSSEELIA